MRSLAIRRSGGCSIRVGTVPKRRGSPPARCGVAAECSRSRCVPGPSAVDPFLRRLRFVHVASSLGSVESLASVPALTSHRHLTPAELAERGIDGSMVRLSLGVEEPEDLVRDLTEALDALGSAPAPPL